MRFLPHGYGKFSNEKEFLNFEEFLNFCKKNNFDQTGYAKKYQSLKDIYDYILEIERKRSSINFDIDGIHDVKRKTESTYIKFGDGYQIDVKGSSSKFNNLAFGTLIKAKSAAQGGNAPINLVIRLMQKNGMIID